MNRYGWALAVMGTIIIGCADSTAPHAPPAAAARSTAEGERDGNHEGITTLTVHGKKGDRTLALIGDQLIFPTGQRLTLDTEHADAFRRLAKRSIDIAALELKLKPMWAIWHLPDPSVTGPSASVVFPPNEKIEPTSLGFCENMGYSLYTAIQEWHSAETYLYQTQAEFANCAATWGPAWVVMCGFETSHLLIAALQFDYWGGQVDQYASAISAFGCMGPGY